MGRLFELVEEYRDRYRPHEPTYSKVAEQIGVGRQTLLNWRTPSELLAKDTLVEIARVTGNSYDTVLMALLEDIGYRYQDQVVVSKRQGRKRRTDSA